MKRLLKILAWSVGALLLLLVTAIIAIPFIVDPNDYRDDIGALVKNQTGRELTISGNLDISVFPWLGLEVGETQLSNAPGFGPAPFARIQHANVKVKLLPLLRRNVELDRIELDGLRLHLARDREGRNNWDDLVRAQKESKPPEEQPQQPGERPGITAFRLGGITVSDAQVKWEDKPAGREAQIADLNLSTGALDLSSPVDLAMDADFAVSAPQAAGHISINGTLRHDQQAERYAVEQLVLALTARGGAVPGGELAAQATGDASVDLKAQTADVKGLRLEAFGARLQTSFSARQILEHPEGSGEFDLQVIEPSATLNSLAGHVPLKLDPRALSGARLAGRIEFSLARGTAVIPDLRATLLGANIGARIEASNVLDQPAARGSVRMEVKDGELLTQPFAAGLPKEFKRSALTGAVLDSGFAFDLATGRATLSDTKINALGLNVSAAAQGTNILSKPAFSGKLTVGQFVPRDLLGKIGIALPTMADPTTLGKASLTTAFDVGPDHAALQDMVLRLDQSTLKGRAAVQRFDPLALRYDLTLDQIDADRYLAPPRPEAEQPAAASQAATAPLQLPMAQLRALDIDGTLRVGKLKAANMQSSAILATLRAKDGLLRVNPASAKLYGGSYSGNLGLDLRGKTPLLSMDETLTGIQVGPLLKDFMGKDYVTGKAQLKAQLNARGVDVMQIRQSLTGNAGFVFEDGAVNGINIAQLLREGYAKFKGQPVPKGETRKTDFSELRGTVTVQDGLVTNKDLSAKSPLLRVTGQGTAHLVTEKVNYRVNASVVTTLEGQGGAALTELKGLTVPVQITGTFTDPKFSVDVAGVLEGKARQALEAEKQKLQQRIDEEKKKAEQELKKQLQDKLKDAFKLR